MAGGEVQSVPSSKTYRPAPPAAPAPPPSRGIESSGVMPFSGRYVERNQPMPAPYRPMGWGKEYNEFYGPTYYYPSEHNVYEGLHPQYYPFFHPTKWPNYKAPGNYCMGKLCGPSSSMYYWDQYDDWKRGERYEQHQ